MENVQKIPNLINLGENITAIVITGGPCSGKTTGLAQTIQTLSDRGYKVLVSPESATKLQLAGLIRGELPNNVFQEEILLDLINQENRIFAIAKRYRDNNRKVVVLCDRGAMDGEAYIDSKSFAAMISRFGFTHRDLCDNRYHAVIHLRTAALGAEKFYTLANNTTRIESVEDARLIDERTLRAWSRHQHPRVIDNSTDFGGKLHRLQEQICAILGDPVPLEKEDKFLIEIPNLATLPVHWNESNIVQHYLVSPRPTEERRIRSREDNGGSSYYYTIKREVSPGVRIEQERMIGANEYLTLRTLRNPILDTIRKRRICFFWKEQFFEVDLFQGKHSHIALMEVERTDRTPSLELPPFLHVIENVTGVKKYSNFEIARSN